MEERRKLRSEASTATRTLSRAWGRLGAGSGRLVALAVVGSISRSLLVIPVAYVLRRSLDEALPQRDTGALVRGALVILVFLTAGAVVAVVTRRSVLRLTQNAVEGIRLLVLDKLYRLPRTYFDRVDDAKVHSLILQDTARLESVLAASVSSLLPAVVVGLTVGAVALYLQPLLFALVTVTLPVTLLVARVAVRRVYRLSLVWQATVDDYSGDVSRALRAMTLTKVVGARDIEIARQSSTIRAIHRDALALTSQQASARAWLGISAAAGNALVLTVGVIQVSREEITAGTLLSFYAVVAVLTRQAATVLSALPQLAAAAASYGRIEELLDASDTPPYSGTQRIVPTGQLELRHVSFSYDDTVVLSDVSLTIAAGEHLALLGPNGSGKSTLAKLVLGLYRPREGQLLVDGLPYDDVELEDLHQASGVVLQDPVVLPGSIWDAITYGRPDLTEVEVHWAAGLVDLHAFVMTLDDGYQTAVGDEGARLSGGQRQRLALARALVGRPRLLVLDEPTNHLDDDAVRLLLRVLGSLEPAPTILSITHDVAFAAAADRVLHLRDGRLTEHTATPVLQEGSR